jgi:hypothetical protein
MANLTRTTRDHEEIRRWAEERGGKPAHVKSTGSSDDPGILRIDFPGYSGEGSLEPIGWDEWFQKFDERNLALIYEEETAAGSKSNFNKIVSAQTAAQAEKKSVGRGGTKAAAGKKAATKKSGAKKSAPKKGAARKAVKSAGKKTAAKSPKKAPVKTASAKKAFAKKSPAKKAAKKKSAAKKKR